MVLTIVELETDLIPAQGAGNILYVYAQDHEITHDVRRTLEVFDGDMNEAIDSIRTFVIDGIIGDALAIGSEGPGQQPLRVAGEFVLLCSTSSSRLSS